MSKAPESQDNFLSIELIIPVRLGSGKSMPLQDVSVAGNESSKRVTDVEKRPKITC